MAVTNPHQAGPAFLHSDVFWGFAFLALGAVSLMYRPFEKIDRAISSETDTVLTIALIGIAIGAFALATKAPTPVKALAVAWVVLP